MHVVRQSVRPKHQVLVLKCYPKFQKGVADVKPNPSELSYLLYYASTRRSKVQKVGAYLEKKTGSDVHRGKVGNVQVTLHIIRGLIDKSPRDLPLYAPYVLRILTLILKSKNLTMIEESVHAFQSFCEHHEAATLAADQELTKLFEDLVRSYAALAGKSPVQPKATMSAPIAIRWKTAGLQAIKSITSSEGIGVDGGRQLGIVMPIILENLYFDSDEELVALNQKAHEEKETAIRRRMSIATVRTAESAPEGDNAVSATTADADRQAEEEAGLLALQSLKQVFSANSRARVRTATTAMLSFLVTKPLDNRPDTAKTTRSGRTGSWTTTLIEMVAKWAPVQDRFVIMVTAIELLVRSPISEETLDEQLVLASVIDWLLGSTINMIGLSVMDVLLGLVQHILLLLQLGGRGSNVLPHHQPSDAIDLFKDIKGVNDQTSAADAQQSDYSQDVSNPSAARQELLTRLRKCIGNLATHIYYSDQVRDIISAILLRLKPPQSSPVANPAAAIERPDEAAQAISESVQMNEDQDTDQFFSFGTARVAALSAVRDVLLVANKKGTTSGAGAMGRNRVGVKIWEGTEWLLRDEDKRVRRAYVDALLTWLRLEISKQDLRVMEEKPKTKKSKQVSVNPGKPAKGPVRPLSNVVHSNKSKLMKSAFLQLIHLAVYDNALEAPEEDSNILLMHLLLVSLVQKLGVNAVKTGLPMIVRLQEDINTTSAINTAKAKVNVGSLVHGFFWALTEVFDFDTTMPGFEIQSEISRRQKAKLWLEAVQMPPRPLDAIVVGGNTPPESIPLTVAQQETLKPFDNVVAMVNQIATSYDSFVMSPPSSPPLSPGRVFSMSLALPSNQTKPTDELPPEFKDAMTGKWSKEACIASAAKESARTVSPHGSRPGTTRSAPNGLLSTNGHIPRECSPGGVQAQSRTRGGIPSPFMTSNNAPANRMSVTGSNPETPPSNSSDHTQTLRIDDLKRVLASGAMSDALSPSQNQPSSVRTGSPLRNSRTAYQDFASSDAQRAGRGATRRSIISSGSESVVDAEGFESASEGDPEHVLPPPQTPLDSGEIAEQYVHQLGRRPYDSSPNRIGSGSTGTDKLKDKAPPSPRRAGYRPRSGSETSTEDPEANARALRGGGLGDVVRGSIVGDDGVPPVPPLPQGFVTRNNLGPSSASPPGSSTHANANANANASGGIPFIPVNQAYNSAPAQATIVAPEPPVSVSNANTGDYMAQVARTDSVADGSVAGSARGSVGGSFRGRRSGRAGAEKRSLVQALLGSIEVGDGGGKGLGRPPY